MTNKNFIVNNNLLLFKFKNNDKFLHLTSGLKVKIIY